MPLTVLEKETQFKDILERAGSNLVGGPHLVAAFLLFILG